MYAYGYADKRKTAISLKTAETRAKAGDVDSFSPARMSSAEAGHRKSPAWKQHACVPSIHGARVNCRNRSLAHSRGIGRCARSREGKHWRGSGVALFGESDDSNAKPGPLLFLWPSGVVIKRVWRRWRTGEGGVEAGEVGTRGGGIIKRMSCRRITRRGRTRAHFGRYLFMRYVTVDPGREKPGERASAVRLA